MSSSIRTHRLAITIGLILMLLCAGAAMSSTFESGDRIEISNLHKINDDLYAVGDEVSIEGRIEGDLVAAGSQVETDGLITGSINAAAAKYKHVGKARGSVRVIAGECRVNGSIGRSLVAAGATIELGEKTHIKRDATLYCDEATISGIVKGNVEIEASEVEITGQIGGDLDINADKISILRPAVIMGDVRYRSGTELTIDTAEVTVLGAITWDESDGSDTGSNPARTVVFKIATLLAALICGLALLYLFRRYAEETVHQVKSRPSVALAAGIAAVVVSAIAILLLSFALGFTAAGISLLGDTVSLGGAILLICAVVLIPVATFATLFGGILFYAGKIVVGALLGYFAFRVFKPDAPRLSGLQLFAGLVVLSVLFAIPYVGTAIYILVSLVGAGGIVLGIKNCHANRSGPPNGAISG